jgi:hypothetical protein
VANEAQYRFLQSGVNIEYDKPGAKLADPSGYLAYHSWVVGQEPDSGTVTQGGQILLHIQTK